MDLIDHFLTFEKDNNLFRLSYKGVFFWQLIRSSICSKIQLGTQVQGHPDMGAVRGLLTFARKNLPRSFISLLVRHKYDILLSAELNIREVDGEMMDPYLDLIQINLENQWNFNKNIQYGVDLVSLKKGQHDSSFQILVMHYYANWINKQAKHGKLKILPEIKELSRLLEESFAFLITPEALMGTVYKSVMAFRLYYAYYKLILSGRYCMVFLSCHYTVPQFAMIAAARDCGIPSVEHQHGSIAKWDIEYNYTDGSTAGKYFPDYFLTYGEYWNKECRLPKNCQIVTVGGLLFEKSWKKYHAYTQDERTIVFYSGGYVQQDISRLAIQFAQKYAKYGWKIQFKLHPNERRTWKERLPELAKCGEVQVIDKPINIYQILATAKHHVGIASTVLFEAAAFRGCVYIWNHPPLSHQMMDLVDGNYARQFDNVDELYQLLNSSANSDPKMIAQDLYADESTEKMRAFFEKLLPTN